jgi:hypothetical protein
MRSTLKLVQHDDDEDAGLYMRLLSTAVKIEPNLTFGGVFCSRVMREIFLASWAARMARARS